MNPTILVTGATGNVGSEVVKLLRKKGIPFLAAVRKIREKNEIGLRPAECVEFDFLNSDTFRSAFAGIDSIFLIRPPALANPKKDMGPAIAAAKIAGVKRIVFISLLGVEKNPFVPHRTIEKMILRSGISYTFIRPSFFMQNLSTINAVDIKSSDEIFVPAGHGRTSFIDIRDIAAVASEALTKKCFENTALASTGGEALTYYELAAILTRVLGRPITYKNPSILHFFFTMRRRGLSVAFISVMIAIYTANKLGLADSVTTDVEKCLGRKPIQFEQFAQDYSDFWIGGGPTAL